MLQVCLLNYKKGGFPFWNQFFLAPIHDNSGVVEYYLGIQSDVTEQVESARLAQTHLEGETSLSKFPLPSRMHGNSGAILWRFCDSVVNGLQESLRASSGRSDAQQFRALETHEVLSPAVVWDFRPAVIARGSC